MVAYVQSKVKIFLLVLIIIGVALLAVSIYLFTANKNEGLSIFAVSLVALIVGVIGKLVYGYGSNQFDKYTKLGFFSTKIGILTNDQKDELRNREKAHRYA